MRITVRALEPSDYEALFHVQNGPEALAGTLLLPFRSLNSTRARFTELPLNHHWLVGCAEEAVVGMLKLEATEHPRRKHVGLLGMAVRDDMRGRGVGTAMMRAALDLADNWLNLSRIELQVWADNEPAIRLYKRFGFVVEGTHHQWGFRNGDLVDAYTMARVR
ncbi:MAG TPA: GNAT family N-acetyltransferase [Roseiflexaceae bacterium]|nr:GNAT family N-acetyltransferase [Roseiflexaceae bacterium]